ncbi:NADPH-dependent FMN reductase [Psychroflexus sp. S27]|uniref:NADPH-dependent FMN reductase n=1 Tax=Psychroflexus sp. S27 TaxID=1982757 RepID=UPI000C2ACC80|nr:NAD(P)H-dependent oxidoreductase [Psychroflexus sp. S27]PJX21782.1 NADPH-dependent FMN reductase [Psychroflexus sp. S27]
MEYKLKIIVGSTRPGRKAPIVADWFLELAKQYSNFEVELLDLKEIDLPLMDEPNHPMMQKYTKDHTKKWSKTIDEAVAFVFITPEYNYGRPATIKNAMDYLFNEWQEKPVGFVSYGGVSGGTRAVQELKLPTTTLGMMPLPQAVNIPFFAQFINDDNVFEANEPLKKSADVMLNKLQAWTKALKEMREA